jgi:hypothetical protein
MERDGRALLAVRQSVDAVNGHLDRLLQTLDTGDAAGAQQTLDLIVEELDRATGTMESTTVQADQTAVELPGPYVSPVERKQGMETYFKLCPGCQTATTLTAANCLRCGHIYRTKFDAQPQPEERRRLHPVDRVNHSLAHGFKWMALATSAAAVLLAYVIAVPALWRITMVESHDHPWLYWLWNGPGPLARLLFAPQALAFGSGPGDWGYGIWGPFLIEVAGLVSGWFTWRTMHPSES